MAFTFIHIDTSVSGTPGAAGTLGDPYSWGDFLIAYNTDWSGSADGLWIHCKTPTPFDPGAAFEFASGEGAHNQPIVFEGYGTTTGDGVQCELLFATTNHYFGANSGADCIFFKDVNVEGKRLSSPMFYNNTPNGGMRNCRGYNTDTSTNGGNAIAASSPISGCYGKTITTKTVAGSNQCAIYVSGKATAIDCIADVSTGNGSGFAMYQNYNSASLVGCAVIGSGTTSCHAVRLMASTNPSGCVIKNLSVYDVDDVIIHDSNPSGANEQGVTVIGLVAWAVAGYGVTFVTTAKFGLMSLTDCAIDTNAAGRTDVAAMLDFDPITLTANPFTAADSGDFGLNDDAGGGALCKQIQRIGDSENNNDLTQNIGAVQSVPSSGGGGRPRIVQVPKPNRQNRRR